MMLHFFPRFVATTLEEEAGAAVAAAAAACRHPAVRPQQQTWCPPCEEPRPCPLGSDWKHTLPPNKQPPQRLPQIPEQIPGLRETQSIA